MSEETYSGEKEKSGGESPLVTPFRTIMHRTPSTYGYRNALQSSYQLLCMVLAMWNLSRRPQYFFVFLFCILGMVQVINENDHVVYGAEYDNIGCGVFYQDVHVNSTNTQLLRATELNARDLMVVGTMWATKCCRAYPRREHLHQPLLQGEYLRLLRKARSVLSNRRWSAQEEWIWQSDTPLITLHSSKSPIWSNPCVSPW